MIVLYSLLCSGEHGDAGDPGVSVLPARGEGQRLPVWAGRLSDSPPPSGLQVSARVKSPINRLAVDKKNTPPYPSGHRVIHAPSCLQCFVMVFHFVILSVLRVLFNQYSYVNVSLKHMPSNAPTFLGHEKVFDVKTNIFQVYFLFWLIFHIVAFYSPVIFRWNLIRIQILT